MSSEGCIDSYSDKISLLEISNGPFVSDSIIWYKTRFVMDPGTLFRARFFIITSVEFG